MSKVISRERIEEIAKKFQGPLSLMVVGDIGIDRYTYGDVKRISPEAPVPVLEVQREWLKLGLAANISHNLQTLGIKSLLCGITGDDRHANVMESLLEEEGLSTWGIVRDEARPTIYKERVTTNTQQICRIDYEDSADLNEQVAERFLDRIEEFFSQYGAIILEDYAKGTLPKEVIQRVVELGREKNKMIAIDPGIGVSPEVYKGAFLLKPNLKEAKMMARELGHRTEDLKELSHILSDKLELENLVITLGAEGMAMLEKGGEMKIIPTAANEVFDVSGAGDTAISLLSASLLAGASLEEAAWIGNCGAGVVVAKKGTATVSLKELLDFHERLTTEE